MQGGDASVSAGAGGVASDSGAPIIDEVAVAARVEEILSGMTLEQKTAQMTQIQFEDVTTEGARAG